MARSQKKRLSAILALSPKHVKRIKRSPIQPPLPLMDQPVSTADIELWCATVAPRISRDRWHHYAIAYNVADKIRDAKNAGRWPPAQLPMQYG